MQLCNPKINIKMQDATYHGGPLDDSSLFQLGHKPAFLSRMRPKLGITKEFQNAIKLLKSIPLQGSLVPWAGLRRSLNLELIYEVQLKDLKAECEFLTNDSAIPAIAAFAKQNN